ncbi:hypothetical protein CD351_13905 [Erythrobacter sp. KY5]|nr:hypothetical protein CD351_13905 [Erythrobacter sp. KY5]
MIRILFAIFVLMVGAAVVWNLARGDEYSSSSIYASDRSLSNVMKCVSTNGALIKNDIQLINACRGNRRGSCQRGMTYLSDDGQMRLSVQPSDGMVEVRVLHNQPLSSSAIETLKRCTQ